MTEATYSQILRKVSDLDLGPGRRRSIRERRQPALLIAVCLLLALAVGTGFLLGRRQSDVMVATEPPAVEVATSYIEARNDHNSEAALALLAPEATVVEYPVVRNPAELQGAFEYLELVDERFTTFACTPSADEPRTVTCLYEMSNRLVEQAITRPVTGSLRLTVDRGDIHGVENSIDIETYQPMVLTPWLRWLETRTDRGMPDLYRWAFHLDQAIPTPRLDALGAMSEPLDEYTTSG